MKIKTEINKWDLIKLKIFCKAMETINKMKRQPTEGEKIFANDMTEKRLILFNISSVSKKKSKKWTPMVDSCQCMAKPIQYCNVK